MSSARRVTALLLMFAWLFATGHMWMEHGGKSAGGHGGGFVTAEQGHGDDEDHHHHHHHDVGMAAREGGGIVVGAPLLAVVLVGLFLPEDTEGQLRTSPAITGSPPDERRSGYLLVIQTAQPVRGPSVVG